MRRRREVMEAMEVKNEGGNGEEIFGQEVKCVERREKMERKKMKLRWKVKECVK